MMLVVESGSWKQGDGPEALTEYRWSIDGALFTGQSFIHGAFHSQIIGIGM